jgi:hypothetical protein
MMMQRILETVRGLDGVLELAPVEGGEFPELAWGDHFFYYAPDGQVPQRRQPYATIVTKNYPGDDASDLDAPGRWRVNIHIGKARAGALADVQADYSAADTVVPHPVYGAQGWIAVVNPGERTADLVLALLREAHENDRRRVERRTAEPADGA